MEQKWNQKLSEIGITKEDIKQSIESAKTESKEIDKNDVKEYVKQACDIIHENESAFSQEKLTEVALRLSMSQAGNNEKVITQKEVQKAIQDFQKEGYIKSLESGYLTTKEMQQIEKEVISYIHKTNGTANQIEKDSTKIDAAIKEYEQKVGYQMTNDQRAAVHHILQSKDKIIGIQGDAGTGKTTVFQHVRQEMEKRGYEVRGITPTGKAADVMANEAGIKTQTVDSFLMNFSQMKIVDNKQEYIRQYEKINQKFETKNWSAPKSILGYKSETWESELKNFLKNELGKKEEKIEHCYKIDKGDFQGKMIVEHRKTALGGHETHVWVKNEKTGDITYTRYAHAGSGILMNVSVKEKSETWINPDKVIEKGKEVWVVDETSMMGSKEVKQLLDAAKQTDARVIFTGDTKQLASVEAGQIFKDMQQKGMNTIEMTEKVRQKNMEYRQTVDAMGKKEWDTVKEKMESQNKIKEIQNRDERISEIKKDFLSGDHSKTLITVATNRDKNELNSQIRNELKSQGKLSDGYKFTVRESKNLSSEEKRYAFSYSIGDTVYAQKKDLKAMGINSKNNEFTVSGVNISKNEITIKNANGKEFVVNTKEHGDKFSVYQTKEIEISKNDRIITLKNDKQIGVKNGEMWQVKSIDSQGNITIKNNNKEKTINIRNYNYIDHAYAVTTHKSQGMTIDQVISDVSAQKTNYNEVYTAVTRGKTEYTIYTDNKDKFYDKIQNEQTKTTTLESTKATEKTETRDMTGSSGRGL